MFGLYHPGRNHYYCKLNKSILTSHLFERANLYNGAEVIPIAMYACNMSLCSNPARAGTAGKSATRVEAP
eukprot:779081-Amphidinium_carterae.2